MFILLLGEMLLMPICYITEENVIYLSIYKAAQKQKLNLWSE